MTIEGDPGGDANVSDDVDIFFAATNHCDNGGTAPYQLRTHYQAVFQGSRSYPYPLNDSNVQLQIQPNGDYEITVYSSAIPGTTTTTNKATLLDDCKSSVPTTSFLGGEGDTPFVLSNARAESKDTAIRPDRFI